MDPIIARKLRRGDMVRVVAPALSRAVVLEFDHSAVIEARFTDLGLRLSFGKHVDERDDLASSSISSRVHDLHTAFADPDVSAVMTVIGGYNSNEVLPYLDWDLIAANPKVLCGYSDITALQNAILTRTGLVTYSGPHWSSFGMRDHFEQTLRWFVATLFDSAPIELYPSLSWTDDEWFRDQDSRELLDNEGWWAIQDGEASGRIIGGNLCTLNLLQGTPFMPGLDGCLLMIEDDFESGPGQFARDLVSLLQQPGAAGVQGLVIGRFQRASGLTRSLLERIIESQPILASVPILANADFGHTSPLATLPIGGHARLRVTESPSLTITEH